MPVYEGIWLQEGRATSHMDRRGWHGPKVSDLSRFRPAAHLQQQQQETVNANTAQAAPPGSVCRKQWVTGCTTDYSSFAITCCHFAACRRLAGLGVPVLRTLFQQVFGQETASNNAAWLRRKLAEAPDSVHGQRRSPVVRARDQGAAIWNQDHPEGEEQQHLAEIPEEGDMLHHQHMAASVFAAASVQRMSGDGTSLAQQMQLDGAGGPAEHRTTPPPSPGEPTQECLRMAELLQGPVGRLVRNWSCCDSCC